LFAATIKLKDNEESPDTLISTNGDPKQSPAFKKKKDKEIEQTYKLALQCFEGKNGQRNFKKAVKVLYHSQTFNLF